MGFTDLRKNGTYVRYYSLLGSAVVMIILPVLIMVTTYISLCRSIPTGTTKKRTINIVLTIIFMFVICHLPKVFLTTYELLFLGTDSGEYMTSWPSWFMAFNEVNTLLLVIYSAMNPVAYCGKLVFQELQTLFLRWFYR